MDTQLNAQQAASLLRFSAAHSNGAAEDLLELADAIEAAAGKRVVLLDVVTLGFTRESPERLRAAARTQGALWGDAERVLRHVASALDDLAKSEVPEPKEFGAKVTARAGGLGTQRFVWAPGRDVHKPWLSEGRDHYSWRELHDVRLGWDEAVPDVD